MHYPLRIGIIGCGDLGIVHARRFESIADTEVVAACDPSEAAISRLCDTIGRRPRHTGADYRRLLEQPLDAVCIASPDALHVAQLLDALGAGLHVLCEKPLTPFRDELEQVITARDRARAVVALTYPRRYDPGHRAVQREIASGRWGRVTCATAYNAEDWVTRNAGTWRHDPAMCPGGFFYDASGHQLDFVLWAAGLRPESVWAQIDCAGRPVPIRAWGSAALEGGVPFTFHFVGDARAWREQINIHCERMDFFSVNFHAQWCPDGKRQDLPTDITEETADERFVDILLRGAENLSPLEEVGPVLDLTAAAIRSAATGQRAMMPLQ